MNRRLFIGGAVASASLTHLQAQCGPTGCRAQVNVPQMMASTEVQQCPEWCWATCISMIFSFYGFPVDQKQIVQQRYGNVVCLPAGTSATIAAALSGVWIDSRGVRFKSTVVAGYDPANGVNAINNAIIVNELASNHPLLYCNRQHAMVNYAVDYIPGPMGPTVTAVGVVDPWPTSPRAHALSMPEMVPVTSGGQMTFLASVRITRI